MSNSERRAWLIQAINGGAVTPDTGWELLQTWDAYDALYQAAKDVLAYGHGRTAYAPTALAAAVRRVESGT